MKPVVGILGMRLPVYGLMALLALTILMVFGIGILRKKGLSLLDGFVLGQYGLLGAFLGAKLFYYLEWSWGKVICFRKEILHALQGGGSASGAILLGLSLVFLGGKIHHINVREYLSGTFFLLPLCHGVWKLGCFFSGCCYGIPYDGFGSILFPKNSHAPSDVPLFPVQLLESVCLFALAGVLRWGDQKVDRQMKRYFLGYGSCRFVIEFFRNDAIKRKWFFFSDIQWLCLAVVGIICIQKLRQGEK